jgi:hypothetical protein
MGRQAVDRAELGGNLEELVDFRLGVQPWWSSCLPVAEIPRGRYVVPGIVEMELRGPLTHGLVPSVALGERRPQTGPRDDRRRPDHGLTVCAGIGRETAQQVLVVTQRKPTKAPDRQIGFDRGDHDRLPGQG